jgi:hypothetical protein
MTKESLDRIIESLEDKKIKFALDTHIHDKSCVRGIFIYDADESSIKGLIGNETMKDIKLKKTYIWYLGEKKKSLLLKFKNELVLEIPAVESYGISSTA